MEFEDILKKWENRSTPDSNKKKFADMIDAYPPNHVTSKRDNDSLENEASGAENRSRLRGLDPQRSLDLHGCRAKEADAMVREFINRAVADGLEKVLIIHGKGKHSITGTDRGSNILKDTVYSRLRSHPLAGETGVPERRLGGSGAVWVALRRKRRK